MRWIMRYEGESQIGSPASRLLQIRFRQRLPIRSQTTTDRVPPATSDLQPDSYRSGSGSDFRSAARQLPIGLRQRLLICSQIATDRVPPEISSAARQRRIGFRQSLMICSQAAYPPVITRTAAGSALPTILSPAGPPRRLPRGRRAAAGFGARHSAGGTRRPFWLFRTGIHHWF